MRTGLENPPASRAIAWPVLPVANTLAETLALVPYIAGRDVLILSALTPPPVRIDAKPNEARASVSEVYFVAKASEGDGFRAFGEITRTLHRVDGLDGSADVQAFIKRLDARALSYHAVIRDTDREQLAKAWRSLKW